MTPPPSEKNQTETDFFTGWLPLVDWRCKSLSAWGKKQEKRRQVTIAPYLGARREGISPIANSPPTLPTTPFKHFYQKNLPGSASSL